MRKLRDRRQPAHLLGLILAACLLLAAAPADSAPTPSSRSAMAPSDTQPPSVPQGMAFSGTTRTTVSLVWRAASDNVGVAGYRLFRDGVSVATVTRPGHVFRGLKCGTRYTFTLEAYDAAGNRSNGAEATGSIATNACAAGPGPSPAPAPPSGAAPTAANLWVDTNGGSCARSATRRGYVDSRACSWNRAYRAARTGDLILVKGGSYGDVAIGPSRPSISPPGITFRTASRETVRVEDFENGFYNGRDGGDNIRFVGPVRARTFRSDQTDNIVVDRWNVDCRGCADEQIFHLEENNNVLVRNSEISDNTDNSLIWINGSNITFDNNRIHDAGLRAGSGAHTECMYVWNVTNLTLKRNHFYHCSVMDVFITGGDVARGGVVENNVFERPWETTGVISRSAYAFHFRDGGSPPTPDPDNWDFRYNTFVGPLSVSTEVNPVGSGGMRVIGNVFLSGSACGHGRAAYAYNAFVSRGCGTNRITYRLSTYLNGFVDPGDPGVYGLRANSVLRDKGHPKIAPATDRAGRSRRSGKAADIGAYEFG